MKRRDFITDAICLGAGTALGLLLRGPSRLAVVTVPPAAVDPPAVPPEDHDAVLADVVERLQAAEPRDQQALPWLLIIEGLVYLIKVYCTLTREACRHISIMTVLRLKRHLRLDVQGAEVDRAVGIMRLVANQASDQDLDRFIRMMDVLARDR